MTLNLISQSINQSINPHFWKWNILAEQDQYDGGLTVNSVVWWINIVAAKPLLLLMTCC